MGGKKKNKKGASNKQKKQQPSHSQQGENQKATSAVDNNLSWRKPLSTVPSNNQQSSLVLKVPVVQGFGPSWINGECNSNTTLKPTLQNADYEAEADDCDYDAEADLQIKISSELSVLEQPLRLKKILPVPDTNLENRPDGFYFYYSPWNARKYAHHKQSYFSSFNLACKDLSTVGFADFISDADNIKRILNISNSEKFESFILHRIGNTILVDSLDMQTLYCTTPNQFWPWFENYARNLIDKKIVEGIKMERNYSALRSFEASHSFFYYCLEETVVATKLKLETNEQNTDSKDAWKEGCDRNAIPIPEDAEKDDFLRTFEFAFATFVMKLGSNSPVLYKDKDDGEAVAVSLRTHDITSSNCLKLSELADIFFEQILLGVNQTLVGHHLDMNLKRLEWLRKTSIFKGRSLRKSDLLSNGINMLELVKSTVDKPGHSYWLYKAPGEDHKFVDLTAEMQKRPGSLENPYGECYASLLYRICLQFCHEMKPSVALTMLDHAKCLLYQNHYQTVALDKPWETVIKYYKVKNNVANLRPDVDVHTDQASEHKNFVHVWEEAAEAQL